MVWIIQWNLNSIFTIGSFVCSQGKAEGSRTAIWVRSRLQAELFHLGCLVYCHPGKVIFVAILLLASFCVGLKSVVFHSKIEQLWVEGKTFFLATYPKKILTLAFVLFQTWICVNPRCTGRNLYSKKLKFWGISRSKFVGQMFWVTGSGPNFPNRVKNDYFSAPLGDKILKLCCMTVLFEVCFIFYLNGPILPICFSPLL